MKPDRVRIVAEAGVNHDGSMTKALALVDAAREAGADVVKFQTFDASSLVTASAPRARYQEVNIGAGGSQRDMLRGLELSADDHRAIVRRCEERSIAFLSTPFDLRSLTFLTEELGVDRLKIGSGELTNAPFLVAAAATGLPIILSTGMGTLAEVGQALGALAWSYLGGLGVPGRQAFEASRATDEGRHILRRKVVLMQCTTSYPTPMNQANLRAMTTLEEAFGLPVGFSDHTPGIALATASVALGAVVVEKHLTLDRHSPGPDHAASIEPSELAQLVRAVRDVEAGLGDGQKRPMPCELENVAVARKRLTALRPIRRGELFTAANLGAKRPGNGRSPSDWWGLLGTPADRDYGVDDPIAEEGTSADADPSE